MFYNQKSFKSKRPVELVVVIALLCLAGWIICGFNQATIKPLNHVYYGNYKHANKQNYLILAFDKNRPKQVGMRLVYGYSKVDGVQRIKYSSNTVTLRPNNHPMVLQISNAGRTLTCAACNGVSMPKTYSMQEPTNSKVGGIALSSITKEAKKDGMYDAD